VIQRTIEILRSIPTIPLWMGLAAPFPDTGRSAGLLRHHHHHLAPRLDGAGPRRPGRFLSLREEDFVRIGAAGGCSQMRTIFVHMVPSFMSHIIAATTLALPAMIISETALSFSAWASARPPSAGGLAPAGPERQTVAISPWLMLPRCP